VQRNIRKTDVLARYGGEEFVILVPRITCTELKELAERLRRAVAIETFCSGGKHIPVTISIGYAIGIPQLPATNFGKTIVKAADEGMCLSKQNGRNRATMRIGATGLRTGLETGEEHPAFDLAPS
jgi:diguanylate cyclase (GGDEF)-like protein